MSAPEFIGYITDIIQSVAIIVLALAVRRRI